MNTFLDFDLVDGRKIKLTLNLKRLLLLKGKHRDTYNEVNRIITKGADDIFDMVKVIYTAYLCALDTTIEEPMSYDTFLDVIPQDIGELTTVVGELISPKKK